MPCVEFSPGDRNTLNHFSAVCHSNPLTRKSLLVSGNYKQPPHTNLSVSLSFRINKTVKEQITAANSSVTKQWRRRRDAGRFEAVDDCSNDSSRVYTGKNCVNVCKCNECVFWINTDIFILHHSDIPVLTLKDSIVYDVEKNDKRKAVWVDYIEYHVFYIITSSG